MARLGRSARYPVAAALAAALALAAGPAITHELNVFAFVEGDTVVVEAKFSNGRAARAGTVRVFDGSDALVEQTRLGDDGTARVPLAHHEAGLKIEVSADDGHSNYWILTPLDIAAQRAGAAAQP